MRKLYPGSGVGPQLLEVDALAVVSDAEEGEDEDDAQDGPDEVADGDDAGVPEMRKEMRQ
jgi:hypothetical protein